jgi:acetyl esterase
MKRRIRQFIALLIIGIHCAAGCTATGIVSHKPTALLVRKAVSNRADKLKTAPEPVAKVENLRVPGQGVQVPMRMYTPAGAGPFPILVYMHGGGWVTGSLETHDSVCRFFTNSVRCIVISVDYRLAPEHKFPAAVEDVYAVANWAVKNAYAFNGDPERVAVAGDSAGANLAAVVCLMARDRGGPWLVFQLLAYPPTDLTSLDTGSYRQYSKTGSLSKMDVSWFRKQYLRDDKDRSNPYVSPLLTQDLARLPPALVITGEFDVLRDDGEAYAKRLQQSGVRTRCIRNIGKSHAAMLWAVASPEVRDMLDEAAKDLRTAFAH